MTQLARSVPSGPATLSPARSGSNQEFSDADFEWIARRAHKDFGLHLPSSKKDLVYSRLIKRVRALGLPDFGSYCALLESPAGEPELGQMLSALTTNVTHFFREEHHFKLLREKVLPPLIKGAREGKRVRLWSAGCSAGQEPYSLAFTLLDMCPEAAKLNIRILATDIDPVIVAKAEAGIYPSEELKAIPEPGRTRYLQGSQAGARTFSIGDKARELVSFGLLNLIETWPMSGPFDIIFCRNVAIYFDKSTQARLWHRFGELMPSGGYLFIGHSERVAGPAEAIFSSVGVTAYCKS